MDAVARRALLEKAPDAHTRKVVGRIPLYGQALAELRAAAVAGEDPKTFWPKAFAPLTREERRVVRQRFLEQLAKGGKAS